MNPTTGETIVREITIKAPAKRIFEALSDPDQRLKWWAVNTSKGHVWNRTCVPEANGR